ncbi:hypothetical protein ACBJ59_26565 [Nonomuraea sp. MTCD27]|uniref:hypothetical protein n=1 Tax=Nonomuraea sp. MTCD27 TaxID=1676747 RepID=UPI0035C1B0FE
MFPLVDFGWPAWGGSRWASPGLTCGTWTRPCSRSYAPSAGSSAKPPTRAVGRVVGEAADTAHEWQRQPPETWLRSSRWPHAFVAVERLKDMSHLSGELRRAVAATGLPMDEMVYMTVHE